MSVDFELSVEVSQPYDFSKDALPQIEQNRWVKNQWPLVYFIQNDKIKIAYVGESTNALHRIKNHLANPQREILDKISIIGSDKFNNTTNRIYIKIYSKKFGISYLIEKSLPSHWPKLKILSYSNIHPTKP